MIKKRFNGCTALIIAIMLVACHSAHAQEQSLFEIQRSFELGRLDVNEAALQQLNLMNDTSSGAEIIKCATPILAFLYQHKEDISPEILQRFHDSKFTVSALAMRKANTYISESGMFEIFYETSGPDSVSVTDDNGNGVPDYVEWVGEAADSSYRHEIETIGFKDPVKNGLRYEILIKHLGPSIYGLTSDDSNLWPCINNENCIYIENDFLGFDNNTDPEGDQKGAIKVTMAHEFKHAIQFGLGFGLAWNSFWAEMDATLMEEVVYDNVNDYYNYIKHGLNSVNPTISSIFGSPDRSLSIPRFGYNTVTWMIYYYENFGMGIWKDVWEQMESKNIDDMAEALSHSLSEPEFNDHFTRSYLWHFASGERAPIGDYGFDEKFEYPNASIEMSAVMVPEPAVEVGSLPKLSARFYEIFPNEFDKGFIDLAVNFDTTQAGLAVIFYLKSGGIKEYVASGENKTQVYMPTDVSWEDVERAGVVVANPGITHSSNNMTLQIGKNGNRFEIKDPDYLDLPEVAELHQNYPNPFNPETIIEFILQRPSHVKLEVYDLLGRKVQTLAEGEFILGPHEVTFDAAGLASGLYIYRLQADDKVLVKKMILAK